MKTDEQYDEMVQIFIKAIDTLTRHNAGLEYRLSRKVHATPRLRDKHGHFAARARVGVKFVAPPAKTPAEYVRGLPVKEKKK